MRLATDKRKSGFTLVEVVVASALMCLVVAASYIGISTVMYSARRMSQRVTAQGMCLTLFEEMKGCVFGALVSSDAELDEGVSDPVAERAAFLMAQGLGPGSSDVSLTYTVDLADDAPTRRNVHIVCTWKFASPFGSSEADATHTEELFGVILESFSSSGKKMYLDVNHLELNPNYNAAAGTFITPAYMRITDTSGNVYTQTDLTQNKVPSSINATSVIIYPGGGGEQSGKYSNARTLKINNAKTYAYYSSSDSNPISVTISSTGGKYYMNMHCDDAAVNIE